MTRSLVVIVVIACFALTGCKPVGNSPSVVTEDLDAKALLQGIWLESATETVSFRAEGDTIYYPDSTSQPAYFRIAADTLYLGSQHYAIVEQDRYHFCFQDMTGEVVRLVRSQEAEDTLEFSSQRPEILSLTEVVKIDSVINYGGQRYHWYIAFNPTKYQIVRTTYNSDGIEVKNVYYDNIVHLSLYNGSKCLFSRDIRKQLYVSDVPQSFLDQAILANMQYDRVDAFGFHFNVTLCIPDGSSCYLMETCIGFDGQLSMKLLEY